MRKLTSLAVVGCLLAATMTASAGELSFFGPTLRAQSIGYVAAPAPQAAVNAAALYPCVKYRHTGNIAPCAVKRIVKIKDPCSPKAKPCDPCAPKPRYVYVEICVPSCGCVDVRSHGRGSRVTYDYGKYKVRIASRRSGVTVSYHK